MTASPQPASRREFLRRFSISSLMLGGAWGWLRAGETVEGLLQGQRKLGVALVGLGGYASGQLGPALLQTQLCRLRAVVTGDAAKGRRWAEQYGFPPSSVYHYDTMEALADNPEVDIVYVVTPPALHREPVEKAARAGKHVISEKPMATTVADCDAMIAACREAGVALSIGYRLHFHPYHERVKALARSGEWGPFETIAGGFGFPVKRHSWRLTQALGGGGPLMDVGIYVIQSACMAKAGAAPVRVRAVEDPKSQPELFAEVEEGVHFELHFADGAVCRAESSFARSSNRFRAEAAGGWIALEPAFSYDGLRGDSSAGALPVLNGYNQQAAQMDGFAASLLRGEPSIVPGEMGRRDMVIIRALYESARTGAEIAVEV